MPGGKGLAATFEEAWDGTLRAVSVDTSQTSFLEELAQTAASEAQALVVIAFEGQALSIVRQAVDEGFYSQFVFGDAAKRVSLVREIGGEKLGGMYGTAGASAPRKRRYSRVGGRLHRRVRRTARSRLRQRDLRRSHRSRFRCQAAGSLDGTAIRDQLRTIAGPPGQTVSGHSHGSGRRACLYLLKGKRLISTALPARWTGTTTATSRRGHIGTWRFTSDGRIEELDAVYYENPR